MNAYGNGSEWTIPSGWSIFTSKGNTAEDRLATCIAEAAKKHLSDMKMRADYSDGDIDFEEGFYLLKHTMPACVLSENGFMTNEKRMSLAPDRTSDRINCNDARGRDCELSERKFVKAQILSRHGSH